MTDGTGNLPQTNGAKGDHSTLAGTSFGAEDIAAEAGVAPDQPSASKPPSSKGKGTGDGWFGLGPKLGADDCLPSGEIARFHQMILTLKDPPAEVAEEVSATLSLAQKIRSRDIYISGAAQRVNFALQCLLVEKPLLTPARDVRLQLQIEVYSKSGLVSRMLARISDGSPVGLVLAALIASLFLWTVFAIAVHALVNTFQVGLASDVFFMNGRALAVIASAAFVGGVVSIATRLQEFSRVRDLDPFAMFWTALLKPLIGVILSFFILATLAGGVIRFGFLPQTAFTEIGSNTPQSPDAIKALYVLWMLGFLAGFSERFAWDFVKRAEGAASGSGNPAGKAGDKPAGQ